MEVAREESGPNCTVFTLACLFLVPPSINFLRGTNFPQATMSKCSKPLTPSSQVLSLLPKLLYPEPLHYHVPASFLGPQLAINQFRPPLRPAPYATIQYCLAHSTRCMRNAFPLNRHNCLRWLACLGLIAPVPQQGVCLSLIKADEASIPDRGTSRLPVRMIGHYNPYLARVHLLGPRRFAVCVYSGLRVAFATRN